MSTEAPRQHKLLILDDANTLAMLRNPAITARFPFMSLAAQTASKPASGCVPCQKNAANMAPDYSGIRAAIDSLSAGDKEELKVLLSAERVRVYYQDYNKRPHKSTF